MNELQVAEAVRQQWPDVPVLFITGYAGTRLPLGIEVIRKPFGVDTLSHRIQALLSSAGG
jgi:DNA-binding response OmpR family regulator